MNVKRTQGELKRQRTALQQYERYLPTLQLKKQQVQLEILRQRATLRESIDALSDMKRSAESWSGLLVESPEIRTYLVPEAIVTSRRNIAGVDIPVFERAVFPPAEYDLFVTPFWMDAGVAALRDMVALQEATRVVEEGIAVLNRELRVTTQRVNLFEKVKIPEAKEAIRLIKIYLGDQMTSAVGRSKIAKIRIAESESGEAGV